MTVSPMSRHEEILLNRTLTIWLHRAFALAMFVVGVGYWMRLVGFEPGSRFDLMPVWWRMAAPTLAVLYPVAGIGLWLIAGWGAVIWVLIALVEGVMHLGSRSCSARRCCGSASMSGVWRCSRRFGASPGASATGAVAADETIPRQLLLSN